MTRTSNQSHTLIVAASCAVAAGAYVAYTMRHQENREKGDDDTVCSDMTAKNADELAFFAVPKTPPALPRTTNSPAKNKHGEFPSDPVRNESNPTNLLMGRQGHSLDPPSPVFSRSGDYISDDDISLDGALPPFNASMESSFSSEIDLSKNNDSPKTLLRFLVIVLALVVGSFYFQYTGASSTASSPMNSTWSPMGQKQQGRVRNSLVTRGVTDVAEFRPLGLLLLHRTSHNTDVGKNNEGDGSWQSSLHGCYGPFVGF